MSLARSLPARIAAGVLRAAFLVSAAALPAGAQPCVPAPAGQVSWWPLDEVGTRVSIDIKDSNYGLHSIPDPLPVAGLVDGALAFDGVSTWVDVGNKLNLQTSGAHTVEAWVQVPSGGAGGVVVSKFRNSTAESGWLLAVESDGRARATVKNTGGIETTVLSALAVNDGAFHHLAMTWNTASGALKLYVDGALEGTSPPLSGSFSNNLRNVFIGRGITVTNAVFAAFHGVIDEAAYYAAELSAAEISSVAGAGSGGMCKPVQPGCIAPPAGLVSWWPLDETVGGNAYDIVTGFSGGLNDAPSFVPGMVAGGYGFNGTVQYVLVLDRPQHEAGGAHTVDAWVKTLPGGTGGAVATKYREATAEDGWYLGVDPDGRVRGVVKNGAGTEFSVTSSAAVNDGAFHLLALAWTAPGGTLNLYVDGALDAVGPVLAGTFPGNARNLLIGRSTTVTNAISAPFNGVIDELEWFGRELAPSELVAMYNAGGGGKCKSPTDTMEPVVACPGDIVVGCGTAAGAVVTFEVTANDDRDPNPGIVSVPPSGSLFPLGTTTVVSTATDGSSNSASCSFTVTVLPDVEPPSVTAPGAITVSAPGGGVCEVFVGDADLGTASAADDCALASLARSGVPAGNLFPAGVTIVTWTATDAAGNTGSATQTVTVVAPPGAIGGRVTAGCPAAGTPLLGVRVVVFDSLGTLVDSVTTDADGRYAVADLPSGMAYVATLVTPLGYHAALEDVTAGLECGETETADFALDCVEICANPRSSGFWKNEFGEERCRRRRGHYPDATLCGYLDLIEAHFNDNAINPVVVYEPPASGTCEDKLEEASDLLNLRGHSSMTARARQQLMALLLNVAAGKLALPYEVSQDGATVSQAITYCDQLIDGPASGHELAKNIADRINNNRRVAAGVIPLTIDDIAYRLGAASARFELAQNRPNPFRPRTVIGFSLPAPAGYTLTIVDANGRRVRSFEGSAAAGSTSLVWDGRDEAGREAAPGVYFYRLAAGEREAIRRMVLMR